MQQDIRAQLKSYKEKEVALSEKHASKFEQLLAQEMHLQKPKKTNYNWLTIAASVVLIISLAIQFYPTTTIESELNSNNTQANSAVKEISLGSISPEFNTIETYYTNSINLEISSLEITDSNQEMLEGYLIKIGELTKEYKSLTKELNTKGVNDATIDALISNLQLRLQLLKRLKKQLKQIKNLNTKQDETQII